MVRPHHEADAADRHHGVGHAEITEDRLLRERGNDLADDAESRHDQDVDFRMPEEPEQVLEQDRVAAAGRREERRAEIAVGQQHGDGAGEHRHREQNEEHRHQLRPDEQRHLVHRHAGRAHVEDRRDEIDGAEDRRCAGEMQRENGEVDGGAGMAGGRQRRVDRPSGSDAGCTGLALHEQRDDQQREGRRQQPERDVVHARERHVRRPDHQRHHPIAETADHRGHDHEEDHDQTMRGREHVEHMRVMEELQSRMHQFETHSDRQHAPDQSAHERKHQVHRADVLVIGRIEIAPPAARMVVVILAVSYRRHEFTSFELSSARVPRRYGIIGSSLAPPRRSSAARFHPSRTSSWHLQPRR